jgi:hypothetical protein
MFNGFCSVGNQRALQKMFGNFPNPYGAPSRGGISGGIK